MYRDKNERWIRIFEKLLERHPEKNMLILIVADAYDVSNNVDKAIEILENAIRDLGNSAPSFLIFAKSFMTSKKRIQANYPILKEDILME